jgi:iduronate 2-sulfatase
MYLGANLVVLIVLTLTSGSTALKNVLMLIMDDFRPEIGRWSDASPDFNPKIQTPNLDALASRSLVTKQTYCQQPRCNPSRTSLLTARRPEDTLVFDTASYFREIAGNFTTLPQYFKEMGYQSIGKCANWETYYILLINHLKVYI